MISISISLGTVQQGDKKETKKGWTTTIAVGVNAINNLRPLQGVLS